MSLISVIHPLMLKLPEEAVHNFSLTAFSKLPCLAPRFTKNDPCTIMGLTFPNRLGLAAGLDKNGIAVDAFNRMGFGFIEVGTVTPKAQPGNPKPRLFRIPKSNAIINRMGFNNLGVNNLCKNIAHFSREKKRAILGINLGKNKVTPNEDALNDYLYGMNSAYQYADYLAINISSPNTEGLRDLQKSEALSRLLKGLKDKQCLLQEKYQRYVPLLVKIAPDVDDQELQKMLDIINESKIDGIIATNTTIDKTAVQPFKKGNEVGGLSGAPLKAKSTEIIKSIRLRLPNIAIIAVGGVMSASDYQEKLAAGADLVQIYSGFIYHGPQLIKNCLES